MNVQLYKTWGRDKKRYWKKTGPGPVKHVQNFQKGVKSAGGELIRQVGKYTKSHNEKVAKMNAHQKNNIKFMLSRAGQINGPLRQAKGETNKGNGRVNKGVKG